MSKSGSFNSNIKMELLKKSKTCYWCNKSLLPITATVDHVIPTYRGGKNHEDNYVLACHDCNNTRSVMDQIVLKRTKKLRARTRNLLLIHFHNCKDKDPTIMRYHNKIQEFIDEL